MFLKIMSSINLIGNIFGLILSFCSEVLSFSVSAICNFLSILTRNLFWSERTHTDDNVFHCPILLSGVALGSVRRRTGIEPSESSCFVLKGRDVCLLFVACLFIWFHLGS